MRVLIAYGSKAGGTAGLARMLAADLAEEGIRTVASEARSVREVRGFDAVVVGGALYDDRWHPQARRFVRRHARALRAVPVFMFSSGPLDAHLAAEGLPPTDQVRKLMRRVGAREHVTFGGRLLPGAKGFPARAPARARTGDFRDPARVRDWALHLAGTLRRPAPSET